MTVGQTGLSEQSGGKWACSPGGAGLGVLTRCCYLVLIGEPSCTIYISITSASAWFCAPNIGSVTLTPDTFIKWDN